MSHEDSTGGDIAWLEALAPRAGCLSELQLAERTHDAGLHMAHVTTCAACAERLRALKAAQAAAADELLPAAFNTARAPARAAWPPRLAWGALVSLALAATLAAVVMVPGLLREPHDADAAAWTQKGNVGIYASVLRGEALLEDDALLSGVAPLRPADRLRLRVAGGVASVTVSSWEQDAWQELYRGPVDDDGWLPGSITITDTGATRLRVQVCPPDAPTHCSEQTFNL